MPVDENTYRMGPTGEDEPLAPGTSVGGYEIVSIIGRGGHGTVYLARHPLLGRRAAVKVLRQDLAASLEMAARFLREARVVNRIRHPNIVDISDVGALRDGRPYCVMELLGGRTLAALIRARAPLAPAEAVSILTQVADALHAAHEAGVVHRDVKASNIMVVSEGDPPLAKVLDFGVAKVDDPAEPGLTAVGQLLGSSSARAPEQIRAQRVDRRTDVYALGVLLFQMLTGHLPFESEDPGEVERLQLEAAPPRPSRIAGSPAAFDTVVARAMAKEPGQRYASAAAFAEAARAASGAATGGSLSSMPAVAVHVGIRGPADPGEAALAAQADAADDAEAALRGAGFSVLVATAGEVLGVRLLPSDPQASRAARLEATSLAQALHARLEAEGTRAAVAVHAGDAEVRQTSAGPEVTGGPICDTSRWVPAEGEGYFPSPVSLAGL